MEIQARTRAMKCNEVQKNLVSLKGQQHTSGSGMCGWNDGLRYDQSFRQVYEPPLLGSSAAEGVHVYHQAAVDTAVQSKFVGEQLQQGEEELGSCRGFPTTVVRG